MFSRALIQLLLAAPALAQATSVPPEIQLPGTQPGEVGALESPNKCDNCHGGYDAAVEPVHNWRGSMMGQATRDPIFWATVAVAEQDFAGAGDLCIRCHSTEGWNGGRSTPTDGSGLRASDASGVSCDACHQVTRPDGSEHAGVQFAPFLAHDAGSPAEGYHGSGMYVFSGSNNEKLGPYSDPDSPHPAQQSQFHRSSDFCGTCHDVSNSAVGDLAPNNGAQVPLEPGSFSGVPGSPVQDKAAFNNFPYQYGVVERTYSEHVASLFPVTRVADYERLPLELQAGAVRTAREAALAAHATGDYVDGAPRFFSCQTCHMPPVTGKGCNKQNAPVRADLPLHDMTGGNYWASRTITYLDDLDRLVLGGGVSSDERDALADGRRRARASLRGAAALDVQADTLKVINLTGHKLITGYPEGRRMWLHVTWRDRSGALLREDGAYGALTVDVDGVPTEVDTLLNLEDPYTRVYEAHYGMSQEWAAALVALGWPGTLALSYDRVSGAVTETLSDLATAPAGTVHETFHFVLNNVVVADNRIPPWGMGYDEARVRNILPVPADQYGDPGAGGTYRHWDEVELVPPDGAWEATLELLYQPTSWEYVQFLNLANDGSVSFLADTGDDLLEAWLATNMAHPFVMARTTWVAPALNRRVQVDPQPGVN